MTQEKWDELVGRVKDDFTVEEEREEYDPETRATISSVVFRGPLGRLKIERVVKPRVIGQRAVGGSKFGAGKTIERVFSDEETIDAFRAYRWDEARGAWGAVDAAALIGS